MPRNRFDARGRNGEEGESLLGKKEEGMPCIIGDGVAKLSDFSAFAGSVATADRLVRTMVNLGGCSVAEAVKMITKNPAKLLNLRNLGELKEGFLADIVIFNENIIIQKVIANGKTIL